MRLALKKTALLVSVDQKYLKCLSLKTQKYIDLKIPKQTYGEKITAHEVFGQSRDLAAVLTPKFVWIHWFDPEANINEFVSLHRFKQLSRQEEANSVAVCPKNRFLMVSTKLGTTSLSRVMLLEFMENQIEFRQMIEFPKNDIAILSSIKFVRYFEKNGEEGYSGSSLVGVGISKGQWSTDLLFFSYNFENGVFREMQKLSGNIKFKLPMKLVGKNGFFYASGSSGRLLRVLCYSKQEEM